MSSRSFGLLPIRFVEMRSSIVGMAMLTPEPSGKLRRRDHRSSNTIVPAPAVRDTERATRTSTFFQAEWLGRLIEELDIACVEPEIVAGGQDGQAQKDQCASPNEQRARSAAGNGAEESRLVEFRSAHILRGNDSTATPTHVPG